MSSTLLKYNNSIWSVLFTVLLITSACTKTKEISPAQSKSFIKFLGGSGVDAGYDVKQTEDGGYITVGSQTINDVISFVCYKSDKNGNTTWFNSYGVGVARSVQITSGGYVIAGDDGSNMKVLFINSAGDELSSRIYGKSPYASSGNCIQRTSDGGFIIVGASDAPYPAHFNPVNTKDAYVVRINSNGDTLWTYQYGGSMADEARYIQQKSDGSFIIVGMNNSFPAGENNAWVFEIDEFGGLGATRYLNYSAADIAESIEILPNGGYIILGTTLSSGGDMLLINLEQDIYTTSWTKALGSGNADVGISVKITSDGGFILSGTSTSADDGLTRMNLIKTDGNGTEQWNQEYGGGLSSNTGSSVHQTSDGGYISAGTTLFGENSMILLIKTDENGELIPN